MHRSLRPSLLARRSAFFIKLSAFICGITLFLSLSISAQIRPVYDRGATGLVQLLKKLNTSASVLMIGAHPDDEDTALLAYLARGESARTAYLSLTRGDGGQNIIGPELGEALGVIRTEELLQARRLDGAEQYFTRAYDYGFSKTLAEAQQKWDEKVILCDAVRVIRTFRPLVVVAQFTGTPADGHGQHQFAGYITPIAVKAANDGSQCREAGPVWQVKKFYIRHGFRATGEPKLKINTGRYDPLLGRSYFEIAMEARSQHKSQEQGVLELRGEQFSGLNLVGGDAKESSIFDGLDVSVAGGASQMPIAADALAEYQAALNAAQLDLNLTAPERIVPHLGAAYSVLEKQAQLIRSESGRIFLERRMNLLGEAMVLAAGVQIDALADRETVVPGESLFVGAKAYTPQSGSIKVARLELAAPAGWQIATADAPKTNTPAFVSREVAGQASYFNVGVPASEMPTQPYWLAEPRDGDLFRWGTYEAVNTLPIQPDRLRLAAALEVGGIEIRVERPVEYRFADDIRGEIRRNVDVVPLASVALDQAMLVVPYSDKAQTRRVVMTIANNSQKALNGSAYLNINARSEWKYTASNKTFQLSRTGEKTAIAFDVEIPAKTPPGAYTIAGNVAVGEAVGSSTMVTLAYPHIQTRRFYRRAETQTRIIDLKAAPVKVGYITGSGDRVPEAIRQMGFDLAMISEGELAGGDLSKYDTIVVGIRAFQVRPDVVANNQRLLDYARNGGTLIVQYQLPSYAQQKLPPFPVEMGPRVADENAPMKILVPGHSAFNFPNKITDADWAGWVQERNLYNFNNMPADYTGLIESHDAGEPENAGGLVIAKIGKGNYVYCSYSMFRQLPAGVPGAYRLFANLLSLPKANNK